MLRVKNCVLKSEGDSVRSVCQGMKGRWTCWCLAWQFGFPKCVCDIGGLSCVSACRAGL